MMDKIVGICESVFGFAPGITAENAKVMREIEPLSESVRNLMGYTADKVKIDSNGVDFFIEYSNNLERYMQESGVQLHEAIEEICRVNDLLSESIVIVVDESCIDKIDMTALKENYNVARI